MSDRDLLREFLFHKVTVVYNDGVGPDGLPRTHAVTGDLSRMDDEVLEIILRSGKQTFVSRRNFIRIKLAEELE